MANPTAVDIEIAAIKERLDEHIERAERAIESGDQRTADARMMRAVIEGYYASSRIGYLEATRAPIRAEEI